MNGDLICFDCRVWRSSNRLESTGMAAAGACAGEARIRKGTEKGNRCSFSWMRQGVVCFRNEQDEEKRKSENSFNDKKWISSI
jgi:hypothetical protein